MDYNHPAQPYLKTAAQRLREAGLEVEFYSRLRAGSESDSVRFLKGPDGLRAVGAAIAHMASRPRIALRWIQLLGGGTFRRGLRRLIDLQALIGEHFDVIHLQNAGLYPLLRDYLRAKKIPFVVSFRGHDTVVRPLQEAEWAVTLQEIYGKASVLCFVSEYLKSRGLALGAPEARTAVIRPGVDATAFSIRDEHGRRPYSVASVGRLVWEKALHLALLVMKRLADAGINFEYHIIGDGPARTELERWGRELGIEGHVKWHGMLKQHQLREVLNEAQVFFHPSVSESLPVALLEAMAMEMPVVATRVGGIPEAVVDGETGFLADFGDVEGLAQAIKKLWADAELRKAFGKSARQRVVREFTVEREVEQWVDLYRRVGSHQP